MVPDIQLHDKNGRKYFYFKKKKINVPNGFTKKKAKALYKWLQKLDRKKKKKKAVRRRPNINKSKKIDQNTAIAQVNLGNQGQQVVGKYEDKINSLINQLQQQQQEVTRRQPRRRPRQHGDDDDGGFPIRANDGGFPIREDDPDNGRPNDEADIEAFTNHFRRYRDNPEQLGLELYDPQPEQVVRVNRRPPPPPREVEVSFDLPEYSIPSSSSTSLSSDPSRRDYKFPGDRQEDRTANKRISQIQREYNREFDSLVPDQAIPELFTFVPPPPTTVPSPAKPLTFNVPNLSLSSFTPYTPRTHPPASALVAQSPAKTEAPKTETVPAKTAPAKQSNLVSGASIEELTQQAKDRGERKWLKAKENAYNEVFTKEREHLRVQAASQSKPIPWVQALIRGINPTLPTDNQIDARPVLGLTTLLKNYAHGLAIKAQLEVGTKEEWQDKEVDALIQQHGLGSSGQEGGLYDDQIQKMMKMYEPEFKGVIASDDIKTLLPKITPHSRLGFIINTEPHNTKGEHWQAVYIDARPNGSQSVEFFDSFGRVMPEHLRKDIKLIIEMLKPKTFLKLKENRVVMQKDSTSNCGFFSVRYLIDRFRGVPFADATGWNENFKIYDRERNESEIERMKRMPKFNYL